MKKIISLATALLLLVSLIAGCSSNGASTTTTPPDQSNATPSVTASPDNGETPEENTVTYPLVDKPVMFTCYWPLDVTDVTDLAETQYFQEAAKITNVFLKFDHPASTGSREAFNLIVASQEYPDMMRAFYSSYSQGIDHAIENEIIAPLEDYTEYLPNYMELVNNNDEIKIRSYSDAGHLWGINHIVPKPQGPWAGPVVRQDMLNDIGYTKTPITVDDWEDMLTQLRDHFPSLKNGPYQLVAHGGASMWGTITSAYGVHQNGQFMVIDGKVVYPVLQPGYKDYLMRMNDWYKKGLIWNDYISETFIYGPFEKAANDELAVFDTIYNWLELNYKAASPDPDFELKGVPLPVLNVGDKLHIRQTNAWARTANSLSITTACENVPLACQYWDFAFTEQGIVLGNWGVEGVTFNYDAEGNPKYTDLILKNETGINSAMTKYVLFNSPGYIIWERSSQALTKPCLDAMATWEASADDAWVFPDGPVLTSEEGAEYSSIFNDINTYVTEYANKLIMGTESFDTFDSFIAQIKNMGIERAVEIKQASVDRFYNRLNIIP